MRTITTMLAASRPWHACGRVLHNVLQKHIQCLAVAVCLWLFYQAASTSKASDSKKRTRQLAGRLLRGRTHVCVDTGADPSCQVDKTGAGVTRRGVTRRCVTHHGVNRRGVTHRGVTRRGVTCSVTCARGVTCSVTRRGVTCSATRRRLNKGVGVDDGAQRRAAGAGEAGHAQPQRFGPPVARRWLVLCTEWMGHR